MVACRRILFYRRPIDLGNKKEQVKKSSIRTLRFILGFSVSQLSKGPVGTEIISPVISLSALAGV